MLSCPNWARIAIVSALGSLTYDRLAFAVARRTYMCSGDVHVNQVRGVGPSLHP